MVSYASFVDELMKISAYKTAGVGRKIMELAARHPGKAMLATGGGAVLGLDQLKKLKRRYDIGSQFEKQQREAERAARRR